MTTPRDAFKQYEDKIVAQKKSDLERMAEESIIEYWRSVDVDPDLEQAKTAATEIISKFIQITPPKLDWTMKMVLVS